MVTGETGPSWEPKAKVVDEELRSNSAAIRAVACSSDDLLVTSSSKPVVKVWQVAEAAVTERQSLMLTDAHGAVGSGCVEVASAGEGHLVAVCYDDGGIGLWDLRSGRQSGELPASILTAWKAKFLNGRHRLVSGGPSGTLAFWDVRAGGRLEREIGVGKSSLAQVKAQDSLDSVKRRRTETKVQLGSGAAEQDGAGGGIGKLASPIYSLAVSPDGSLLGCGRGSGTVNVMRLESQEWAQDVQAHSLCTDKSAAAVRALAFDTDSRLLLSGGEDHHVCLFDAAAWARRRTLEGRKCLQLERFSAAKGWVTSASICPDPAWRAVVTASWDGAVKLWDYATHRLLHVYKEHEDSVLATAFGPRGRFFVTAGADARLSLYTAKHEVSPAPSGEVGSIDAGGTKQEVGLTQVKVKDGGAA